MRGARVHFDFRGEVRFCERVFQNALLGGCRPVVVCRRLQ